MSTTKPTEPLVEITTTTSTPSSSTTTAPAPSTTAASIVASRVAPAPTPARGPAPAEVVASIPHLDHVVIVVFENHGASQITGNPAAPYLNQLARSGASFSDAHAVSHPSEPNYLALFSGSTQGVQSDACPVRFDAPNLGSELLDAGGTFVGYAESLPYDGFTGCSAGRYGRKHAPWVDFTNVPASSNLSFARFPSVYGSLPSVSFVVPDICNDMHDCSVATGDTWLRDHLGAYADWAPAHNSLLVVTFDEDDGSATNHIVTTFVGAHIRPGTYGERVDHVRVLRTVEDVFGLPHAGASATVAPITDVWG